MAQPRFNPGEGSPRSLVPEALVAALTVLIDELPSCPSPRRVELRILRSRLCRLFKIPDPQALANESEIAQAMQEADGVPQDDAP